MLTFICSAVQDPDDREFMLWLYEEFKYLMFSTAHKYASQPDVVEDIVQEGLLRLIPRVGLLRGMERCTLASYIVTTIKNISINQLKAYDRVKAHTTEYSEDAANSCDTTMLSMDDLMILSEENAQLREIWPMLSDEQRFILEGKYILGYSDKEMAEQLRCKPSSIRMKLTRARRNALALLLQKKGVDRRDPS